MFFFNICLISVSVDELEDELNSAMRDWLNVSDLTYFKALLDDPRFIAQVKEMEGINSLTIGLTLNDLRRICFMTNP